MQSLDSHLDIASTTNPALIPVVLAVGCFFLFYILYHLFKCLVYSNKHSIFPPFSNSRLLPPLTCAAASQTPSNRPATPVRPVFLRVSSYRSASWMSRFHLHPMRSPPPTSQQRRIKRQFIVHGIDIVEHERREKLRELSSHGNQRQRLSLCVVVTLRLPSIPGLSPTDTMAGGAGAANP